VERVAMEIPTQPSGTRLWQGIRVTTAHDGAAHPPHASDAGIEPDLDLPVTPAGTHLVRAEQDVPGAGTDLPRAVRRGRPPLIDCALHFFAAAPTTKPRTSLGDPALVEEADVERVSAGDQWVGIDPVGLSIA